MVLANLPEDRWPPSLRLAQLRRYCRKISKQLQSCLSAGVHLVGASHLFRGLEALARPISREAVTGSLRSSDGVPPLRGSQSESDLQVDASIRKPTVDPHKVDRIESLGPVWIYFDRQIERIAVQGIPDKSCSFDRALVNCFLTAPNSPLEI